MFTRRIFTTFLLTFLFSIPLSLYAQEATQEPAPAAAQWQVPALAAGLGEHIRLSGQIAERTLFVPVPTDISLVALRATVQLSADVQSGYLEARSGDNVLASIALPANGETITIPLTGAQPRAGVLPLTLVARLYSNDDICSTALIGARLNLTDPVLEYDGNSTPATIADYLPSLLTRLTILVPPDVNAAEATAALRLTAAVTARYAAQQTEIELAALASRDALPATASANPFERTVVIRAAETDALALQPTDSLPLLLITGSDTGLSRQVDLFLVSDALALAPEVQVQSIVPPTPAADSNRLTFDALGFTNLQVNGIGQMELPFTVAQADLGGSVNRLTFNVSSSYTPLQPTDRGTLSLLVNGTLVDAVALDASGAFERSLSVPGNVLARDNTLTARFNYIPAQDMCRSGLIPFTAQISGGSSVEFGRGQTLAQGFARFPQNFVASFQTAFETLDLTSLSTATNLVIALQRTTRTPLQPTVVNWVDALAANTPALLFSASEGSAASLNPPLLAAPVRVVKADGTELLRIDGDAPFAALEAFEQNGRDVLLAQGEAAAVHHLSASLLADPLGWYGLQGDTWLQANDRAPVSMTLRDSPLIAEALTPAPQPWWVQLQPLGFVLALAAVIVLMALAYPRVVRKTPTGANKP